MGAGTHQVFLYSFMQQGSLSAQVLTKDIRNNHMTHVDSSRNSMVTPPVEEPLKQCSNPACGNPHGRWLPPVWFSGQDVKGRPATFKTCTTCRRNDAEKKRKKRDLHTNEMAANAMRIAALEEELGRFRKAHARCLG